MKEKGWRFLVGRKREETKQLEKNIRKKKEKVGHFLGATVSLKKREERSLREVWLVLSG